MGAFRRPKIVTPPPPEPPPAPPPAPSPTPTPDPVTQAALPPPAPQESPTAQRGSAAAQRGSPTQGGPAALAAGLGMNNTVLTGPRGLPQQAPTETRRASLLGL